MLEKHNFVGKSKEDILEQIKEQLNLEEKDIILIPIEEKKGLFGKKEEYEVVSKEALNAFIKEKIMEIENKLGENPQIETKKREDNITYTIRCDKNALLIGKNGRTIDAIQNIVRAIVFKEIKQVYNFIIDVSDYKQKNQSRLERLAKYTAKDVARMNMEIKLDPMNSYERRIIHNILSNSKDVYTISEGEEPNRYVIIKPKGE